MRIQDFERVYSLAEATAAHGSDNIAFVVSKPNIEKNVYEKSIWICRAGTGESFCLTEREGFEKIAFWTQPDTVALIGKRGDRSVLAAFNIDTKQREVLFTFPGGVINIVKTRNGFAFTAKRQIKQSIQDGYYVFDELPFLADGAGITDKVRNTLYAVDWRDGEPVMISGEHEHVAWLGSSENEILYTSHDYEQVKEPTVRLVSHSLTKPCSKVIVEQGSHLISAAIHASGGVLFMGTDCAAYGLGENHCGYLMHGSEMRKIPFDRSNTPTFANDLKQGGGRVFAAADEKLYFISPDGVQASIMRLSAGAGFECVARDVGAASGLDIMDDGSIILISARDNEAQELYRLREGGLQRLTGFNSQFTDTVHIEQPRAVSYRCAGLELLGKVIPPAHCKADKKYPAVLIIHGGPKELFSDNISHIMQIMSASGYYVLYANPPGSDGYGNCYADIRGKWGTVDFDCLMAFVDQVLCEYPGIDAERLGVTGGSYGGFMTNWIISHTNRFKVAVSMRGISNWASKITCTDIGYTFNIGQMGASPWTDAQALWDKSPLKYADRVKTPTLFIHGEHDFRCTVTESMQMYMALKFFGVESRLVVFKEESHALTSGGKPQNRLRLLTEMIEWLDKYIGVPAGAEEDKAE